MAIAQKQASGIPDWGLKLEICRQLLNVMTQMEVATEVLYRPQDAELAARVADSFRKWLHSMPRKQDGPKQFFDELPRALNCDPEVTGARLIHSSVEQFIDYLPDARQRVARDILKELRSAPGATASPPKQASPLPSSRLNLAGANLIRLQHTGQVETISTGLRAGKIDQRHYYLDPDTADSWGRLVRAECYPVYDHCKMGLGALLRSEIWKKTVQENEPSTVVMLAGGGAPTKDLLLVRNLLTQPYLREHLNYYLVDISFYMMRDSAMWLRDHLRTLDGSGKVRLELIHSDILDMTDDHCQWFHRHGSVIFGITGVTIGNVSETAFFQSLDHAANDRDILFVSAETTEGTPSEETKELWKAKYNNPDLHRLIRPVVRAVLSEANSKESVDEALKRIRVDVVPGGERNSSDVPESWSIVVTLRIKERDEIDERAEREVTLVTSTRYQSDPLIEHAGRFGWRLEGQVLSPMNSDYKQFLFTRNKAESNRHRTHSAQ